MKRAVLAGAVVVCGFGAMFPQLSFAGDMKAALSPCLANKTAVGEVPSCGKIWMLKSGEAHLAGDGHLKVNVKGLVLNDDTVGKFKGTPDGVDAVAAAVVCNGKVVAQTEPVPLSQAGDASVDAKVSVPASCGKPVVVLRERYEGKIGGWLAGTVGK
jgi:hypothetical protein